MNIEYFLNTKARFFDQSRGLLYIKHPVKTANTPRYYD